MADAQAAEMVPKLLLVSGKFTASFHASVTIILPVRKKVKKISSFIISLKNDGFLLSQQWQQSSSHLSRLLQQPPKQRLKVASTFTAAPLLFRLFSGGDGHMCTVVPKTPVL